MYYIVETDKTFEQTSADLESAVKSHDFGVLHVHDLGAALRGRGVEFGEECRVFEVCNPVHAAKVLSTDMLLNMVLPCRISVFTDKGTTKIGFVRPVQMLSTLSRDPELIQVAEEVEEATIRMLEDAK
jgi:uncharacterized protein (DUF302 family)